jgi:hypothetical protein
MYGSTRLLKNYQNQQSIFNCKTPPTQGGVNRGKTTCQSVIKVLKTKVQKVEDNRILSVINKLKNFTHIVALGLHCVISFPMLFYGNTNC